MKSFQEAIETGDQEDFINPELRKELESGNAEILGVLPGNGQDYYELIISEDYVKLMERIQRHTKAPLTHKNFPELLSKTFAAFNKISQIESSNKNKLEKLSVAVVLDLPEFELIKNLVKKGELKIDAKLDIPELQNIVTQSEQEAENAQQTDEEGNPSPIEELNQIVAENLFDDTETKLRRRLANTLMQGNAVSKLYLFNMVKSNLDEIDTSLIYNYGMVTLVAQLGYYIHRIKNFSFSMIDKTKIGSQEVVPDGDVYTIKARGKAFPFLVHEIISGIIEYLLIDPDKSVPEAQVERKLKGDVVEQEITDTIAGPELSNKLLELIGVEDQRWIPFVLQSVMTLPIEDIKKIFQGDKDGERIIQSLVKKAKKTDFDSRED